LKAKRDRLLRRWLEHLNEIDEAVAGLSPGEAFAKIVGTDRADSVIVYDRSGRSSYPSITVRAPSTYGAEDAMSLADQLRHSIASENRDETFRLAKLLEDPAFEETLDGHGRVVALNASWLFLESCPSTQSKAFQTRSKNLSERLQDYSNQSIPSSQRRFLMHQMVNAGHSWPFETLPAEDLAAKFLASRRIASPSGSDRSIWSPLPDVWAAETGHPKRTLLLTEATLRGLLQEEMGSAILRSPREAAPRSRDLISIPIGATMPGWELNADPMLSRPEGKSTALYLWVGVLATLAMMLFAWMISRGLLQESRRAQLKQDLASAVSHELKTPLSSMRVFVDLLLEDEVLDETKTREYLQLMANENARLTRLVENFLTFSRLERGRGPSDRERIDAGEFLQETGAAAQKTFAGGRVEFDIEEGLRPIDGNRVSLRSAVMNLLDNACRYSPEKEQVTLRGFCRNGDVCVEVKDHGQGLRGSEKRRVFGAFDRLSKGDAVNPAGCGLGLYIVRSVVEKTGGRVEVDSEPGQGCTFRLILPAATETADERPA
jgi:signal transduction histidine kinase